MQVYGKNVALEYLEGNKIINKVYLSDNFNDYNILNLINKKHLSIKKVKKKDLDRFCSGLHQGIVMDVEDYKYKNIETILNKDNALVVILDHIEDPHNFGAIIRTCEAAGVKSIIIPKDRSVSVTETVMRTSSGALEYVDIAMVNNLVKVIDDFKNNGYFVYAADMGGENYKQVDFADKVLLVIGNEGHGISRLVRENCDQILAIPQYGKINSLNASVAAAVLIYGIVNR